MDNFGIILKTSLKNEVNPTSGEMQYASDTDELVVNSGGEIQSRPNKVDDSRYAISVGSGAPSGGLSGDWYIDADTTSNELMEYFKTINWVARPEGYTEAYIFSNFLSKVDWSGFVTRDGSVKMDSTAYDAVVKTSDTILLKYEADSIISDLSTATNGIGVDGADSMLPSYTPSLNDDVLDIKSLNSGALNFIPPTSPPPVIGAIWNDAGTPKIVGAGMNLGGVEDTLGAYNLDGSQFGRFLAMSTTRILVSSPFYHTGINYQGAAWLFDKGTGSLIERFIPSTSDSYPQMGWGCALSEDRVVVGANYENAVYVYDNNGVLIQKILSPDGNVLFGEDVAVFGNRIVVGSNNNTTGHANVYDKDGVFQFSIDRPEANNVWFGGKVAVSDSLIVVTDSAFSANDNGLETGKAWVYDLDGVFQYAINPPEFYESNTSYAFGSSVAISSSQIFIGFNDYDYDDLTERLGKVYVFNTSGGHTYTIEPSASVKQTEFGRSLDISLDGSRLAIGSWNGYNDSAVKTGANWVYDTATHQLEKIIDPSWVYGDAFGTDVAIEGSLLLSGSYNFTLNSGQDGSVVKFLV